MRDRVTTKSGDTGEGAAEGTPLIGIDDMTTPPWAEGYESVAEAGPLAVARAAPRTVALAVRWAWQTSPRLTLASGIVQLAAGLVTALGLLATADVFTRLLAQGPTPDRVLAALPALALVVGAFAARGLLDASIAALQGALVPRVEQRARDLLHEAVIHVELAAFDDADFAELVDRSTYHGPDRVCGAVRDTGDLVAGVVSVIAAVLTAGLLHPLLAPVVLIAALPQGWAAVRSARLMFASVVRTFSARRRLGVTGRLITGRDQAAELRAFTTQPVLLAEHRRIAEALTAEAVRCPGPHGGSAARALAVRDRHRAGLPGAGAAAVHRRAPAGAGRGGRGGHAHRRPVRLERHLPDQPPLRGELLHRPVHQLHLRGPRPQARQGQPPAAPATRSGSS